MNLLYVHMFMLPDEWSLLTLSDSLTFPLASTVYIMLNYQINYYQCQSKTKKNYIEPMWQGAIKKLQASTVDLPQCIYKT